MWKRPNDALNFAADFNAQQDGTKKKKKT